MRAPFFLTLAQLGGFFFFLSFPKEKPAYNLSNAISRVLSGEEFVTFDLWSLKAQMTLQSSY